MKILCVLSRHAYNDPARGENYDHAHFVPALKSLGHEVEVFDSGDRQAYDDFAALNMALLDRATAFKPDLLFTVLMHYEIWLETLDLIRAKTPARIVNWGTDDSWKFPQASRYFVQHVDRHVTTDAATLARAASLGLGNVVLSQWAASADQLQQPLPAAECIHDVTFVGSLYGNRRRWIEALRKAGIKVECFGHGTEHGVVGAADIPKIYRTSRVSLNFSGSGDALLGAASDNQIKARSFEVPGAGGFLLTEHTDGIERYFRAGEEMATFRNEDELVALVRYYLATPEARDRVARAGHRRIVEQHTYPMRFHDILQGLTPGQTPWQLDARELADAAQRHRAGGLLRAFRCVLAAPLSLAFGAERGVRAARRLAYEASWRFAGETTYRAAGLPGRLFFKES